MRDLLTGILCEQKIAGQTLQPGGTVVVGDSTFSLATTGEGIYVNGESTVVPASTEFSVGTVGVTPTEVAVPSYSGPAALTNSAPSTVMSSLILCWSVVAALLFALLS